jgi:hypothetical protein
VTPVRFVALVVCSALAVIAFVGCGTIYTPPGATTAQKLKDDLSAIGIVEADVKAQCGADVAPLGAQAMAILSIAEAAGNVAAYNFAGAVQAAITALPVVIADGKAVACIVGVLRTDYAKLKPKAAPPASTPPQPAPAPAVSEAEELGEQLMALAKQGAVGTVTLEDGHVQVSAYSP